MADGKGVSIGVKAAVPLLLALVVFAAMHYLGSSLEAATRRDERERTQIAAETVVMRGLSDRVDRAVARSTELRDEAAAASNAIQRASAQLGEFRELRRRANDGRAALERLRQVGTELSDVLAQRSQSQERVGRLEQEKSELEKRMRDLADLAQRIQRMRLTSAERKKRVDDLRRAATEADQKLSSAGRELEASEKVAAEDLVPGATRHPATYVECDAKGAHVMPEGLDLGATITEPMRNAFLERARAKRLVVFLIRPDGYDSFATWIESLQLHNQQQRPSARIDFGYWPVEARWKLTFPES